MKCIVMQKACFLFNLPFIDVRSVTSYHAVCTLYLSIVYLLCMCFVSFIKLAKLLSLPMTPDVVSPNPNIFTFVTMIVSRTFPANI